MGWNNIVIEGFCLGDNPCGKTCPDTDCLTEGVCPHLGYSQSTERMAAFFVPLKDILADRIANWWDDFYTTTKWLLWDRFQKSKLKEMDDFFKSIPVASEQDMMPWNKMMAEQQERYELWKADKEKAAKEEIEHDL